MDGPEQLDERDTHRPPASEADFDARTIERPCEELLTYYIIVCAFTLVLFPIVFIPHYFKYHTLRYHFDDEGVSMSWGILFKRETYLTYRRIQDIHVTRNIIQRWLGLATVGIQTASGTAGMEMSIEGIKNPEALRDYLYLQMRGVRDGRSSVPGHTVDAQQTTPLNPDSDPDPMTRLLTEIRDEVRRLASSRRDDGSGCDGDDRSGGADS